MSHGGGAGMMFGCREQEILERGSWVAGYWVAGCTQSLGGIRMRMGNNFNI